MQTIYCTNLMRKRFSCSAYHLRLLQRISYSQRACNKTLTTGTPVERGYITIILHPQMYRSFI